MLIYNGQLDVIIAWPLTENFITSMKWSGAKKYLKAERTKWYIIFVMRYIFKNFSICEGDRFCSTVPIKCDNCSFFFLLSRTELALKDMLNLT